MERPYRFFNKSLIVNSIPIVVDKVEPAMASNMGLWLVSYRNSDDSKYVNAV